MAQLISTALVIVLMVSLAMVVAVMLHVSRAGVAKTDGYLQGGVGFGALMRGSVDEQDSGSLVGVREGLRASVGEDGMIDIRGTRALSRDEL